MGVSGHTHSQEELDHWADLHNPTSDVNQDDLDNHANQLNPNNDEYWHSRGMEKPDDKNQLVLRKTKG
jgi:hypothetical protein